MSDQNPLTSHNRPDHHRLGQLLRQRQLITENQLQQALSYQQAHGTKLGESLIALGYLDSAVLNRILRRQRWLTPCAACIVLFSPLTLVWADESEDIPESNFTQDWLEPNPWSHSKVEHISEHSTPLDMLGFIALNGWHIYKGEPDAGDMNFSIKQHNDDAYSVQLSMRF